ncbi:MAG: beta-N-acetylhexosaminidase [Bacteroidaceae bacterium]|nr:beta-N-acetylhexosaminidase [Bacteroidaceae bacterium]
MKKILLTVFMAVATLSVMAQRADYRIIPLPQSVQEDSTQVFTLQDGMGIAYDASNPEVARNAQFLRQWVEELTGIKLQLTPDDKKAAVRLTLGFPADKKAKKPKKGQPASQLTEQQQEAYTITVNASGIQVAARQPIGLFRAAQTLRKALPLTGSVAGGTSASTSPAASAASVAFPFVTIQDQPRFEYRGAHLDCARHYFSLDVIKRYLDLLALHGCNQFHWHFTEDQGWRFEVKALPELAKKGSVREQTVIGRNSGVYDGQRYGGYYTQAECRELVNYAAERYINIIPEIDLPGHMQGALHVYPNLGCTGGPYPVWQIWGVSRDVLCAGNPETMKFLKTVVGELCDVFPSKYIHIGGDECPKDRWKTCPKCQAKARELGLKDDGKHSIENQLQTWINHEMEQFLKERGRDMIGWDEVLEGGLTEGGIVMSWRGINGGIEAAKQNHRVIMTPTDYCYIDYYQLKEQWGQPLGIGGYLPVSKVYSFEPLIPEKLSEEEQQYILGPQVNLWTEYVAVPQHVFYMLLPRLDAISEVQWCQSEQKNFDDFKARLPRMLKLYDRMGINYCHKVE